MNARYTTEQEIEAVVRDFETCTLAKEAFRHREHLTVAVWYLHHFSEEQALEKMRSGLLRFLEHHQVGAGKYKEELTVAWISLIKTTIDDSGSNLGLVEITNQIIHRLGERPELIEEAREGI